jgi:hypothetical protein
MLTRDVGNYFQKNPEALELTCGTWMQYYSYMLGLIGDDKIYNYYFQEHFNEVKWYDV